MVIDTRRAAEIKEGSWVTSAVSCSGLEYLTEGKKYQLVDRPWRHNIWPDIVNVRLPIRDDNDKLIHPSCFYFKEFQENPI